MSDAEVFTVRRLASSGAATIEQLAARFGVSIACIEAIIQGRPWRRLAQPAAIGDLFCKTGANYADPMQRREAS
jgi:hypothetical protein